MSSTTGTTAAPGSGLPFAITSTTTPPAVDFALHALNRARLVDALVASLGGTVPANAVIVLEGGKKEERHDTDHELLFRQESWFHWAFGVREPDCFGVIELQTKKATLLVPKLPAEYAVWMGPIFPPAHFQAVYGVEACAFVEDLGALLATIAPARIYRNVGLCTDSGSLSHPATLPEGHTFTVDDDALHPVFAECRVHKTEAELDMMRYACIVSSEAHMAVMAYAKPGLWEYQLESLFKHWCYHNGACRNCSYTCICASGSNGAILHYGHAGAPNDRQLRDHEMCLFDMGSEYHCYASDITCSWPSTGVFTPDQRIVYEAVLAAQYAVIDAIKPGVCWVDMHTLAFRTILEHLTAAGLLQGSIDDMMAVNLAGTFMSHGLGHMIGIDTHDAGGYLPGMERIPKAGYKSLRTMRILEENMCLTVEPGCYFVDVSLDAALADPARAKFMNKEAIARFRGFGGVRIEDVVRVTATGVENLTWCPRTVADIEGVMSGRIKSRFEFSRRGGVPR